MFINIILLSIFYFYVCFWFPDWFRSRYHCIRWPKIHFFLAFLFERWKVGRYSSSLSKLLNLK